MISFSLSSWLWLIVRGLFFPTITLSWLSYLNPKNHTYHIRVTSKGSLQPFPSENWPQPIWRDWIVSYLMAIVTLPHSWTMFWMHSKMNLLWASLQCYETATIVIITNLQMCKMKHREFK
jgi:hypothetical protein